MTIVLVTGIATVVILYARGFTYTSENGLTQQGLLLVKSVPDGAQVLVNGIEKTVTDGSLKLEPGIYDIAIKKDGYIEWEKSITIKTDEVIEVTAHLFRSAPSLSALTFGGAESPVPSRDFTKLAFLVLPSGELGDVVQVEKILDDKNIGLYILEMVNLPLGFSTEPRRITSGDLAGASFIWSPNGRELLLTIEDLNYLLPTNEFTPSANKLLLTEIQVEDTLEKWQKEVDKKQTAQIKKLPKEFRSIFENSTSALVFSPDKDLILYTASASAILADGIVKSLPGASTQKQERNIKPSHTYVYDIEEDRNFLINDDSSEVIIVGGIPSGEIQKRISWYPTSRNLIIAEPNKITIADHDNTNRQSVYSGSFISPQAFPTLSFDRIMILTTLGAIDTLPNIYSLSLK